MSDQVHEDLLEIVQNSSQRLGARICGFEYLLGLSATEEGVVQIVTFKKYVPFLVTYIEDTNANESTLVASHKCLINISANQEGASAILNSKKDLILCLLNKICDKDYKYINYVCYLLSNLATCSEILKQKEFISDPTLQDKLAKGFLSNEEEIRSKYKFLALFFATISGYSSITRILINSEPFAKCFVHPINLEEPFERRLGLALTLRNLCSETDAHKLLLDNDVLSVLLLPLMGPEEYEEDEMDKLPVDCQYLENTKQREPIPQIRRALVQALSLLCYTEDGWNFLKTHSVYCVARDLHKWESDPVTQEAIETLVGFLLVEKYNRLNTVDEENKHAVPSVTEVVKDVPDFIVV